MQLFGKGAVLREQPASMDLIDRLLSLARKRGARRPSDAVLRFTGLQTPMTARRFDSLLDRFNAQHRWADDAGISFHDLRHKVGRKIERASSQTVAEAFLGHAPTSMTGRYTSATVEEVFRAWQTGTGESHPLAVPRRRT